MEAGDQFEGLEPFVPLRENSRHVKTLHLEPLRSMYIRQQYVLESLPDQKSLLGRQITWE